MASEAVNRRIVEYCGRTLEELREWGTNGTIHAEDAPHVAESFASSIASGIPYEIEQRIRRFDGEYRWFSNRGVPGRDESGRILCWYVLLTDIDERKRFEGDLRRSEAFLAEAQRLSETGSFLWSPETDALSGRPNSIGCSSSMRAASRWSKSGPAFMRTMVRYSTI